MARRISAWMMEAGPWIDGQLKQRRVETAPMEQNDQLADLRVRLACDAGRVNGPDFEIWPTAPAGWVLL